MSAYTKKYFSMDAGLNYKHLLKHFKDQAEGRQSILLIKNPESTNNSDSIKNNFKRQSVHSGLVLVDMGGNNDVKENEMPKVEMVDPTEGDRRRALAKLSQEKKDKKMGSSYPGIKAGGKGKRGHSDTSGESKSVKKLVKKTKALFDD